MSEGDVARLERRLDLVMDGLGEVKAAVAGLRTGWDGRACHDHEARLRRVEVWQWKVVGIVAAVSAIPGIVALVVHLTRLAGGA